MSKNKKTNIFFFSFYILAAILIAYSIFSNDENNNELTAATETPNKNIVEKLNQFGLNVDSLISDQNEIKRNQTLSDLLIKYNINSTTINYIASKSKGVFDVRKIVSGKPYYAYLKPDSINKLVYFVYEQNPINYVVFDLSDSINIYKGQKEVTLKRKSVTGKINQSLYVALTKKEADPELVEKLSEVFAWQIDFYHIQKGDYFKVIYNEKYVDNKSIGVEDIIGAYFNYSGDEFYAIEFDEGNSNQYFDENGNSLRKAFLKAPLKFSRISSRYSIHRYHPILKRVKPHLGTDYAAPTGTPIHTVGDGVVIAATYSRYNGNYVKVRHNSIYSTQYLHMSKIASGIRPGVKVKQGEVIGFVGSTGLATGPHLCFRFWKNGRQVDPLKEKIPPSKPVKKDLMNDFIAKKDEVTKELNSLKIKVFPDSLNLALKN